MNEEQKDAALLRLSHLCNLLRNKYPKAEVEDDNGFGSNFTGGYLYFSSTDHAICFGEFKDGFHISIHSCFKSEEIKSTYRTFAEKVQDMSDSNLLNLIQGAIDSMIAEFRAFEKEEDDALAAYGMVRDRTTEAVFSEEIQSQL